MGDMTKQLRETKRVELVETHNIALSLGRLSAVVAMRYFEVERK